MKDQEQFKMKDDIEFIFINIIKNRDRYTK